MKSWILLICLFFSMALRAQNPAFINYTIEEGLPSNIIYNCLNDQDGYMWFGTNQGLCRFDGLNVKRFQTESQIGQSITDIQQDKLGRIWCHNFSGQIFFLENDSLQELEAYRGLKNGIVHYQIRDQTLVANTDKGQVFIYNVVTGKSQLLALLDSIQIIDGISSIEQSQEGFLVMAKDHSLQHLRNGVFTRIHVPKNDITPGINCYREQFKAVIFKSETYLYLQSNEALYTLKGDSLQLINPNLNASYNLGQITYMNNLGDKVAINSYDGFCLITDFETDAVPPKYLSGVGVSNACRDQEGSYWFGTLNGARMAPSLEVLFFDLRQYIPFNTQITTCAQIDQTRLVFATSGSKGFIYNILDKRVEQEFNIEDKRPITRILINHVKEHITFYNASSYTFDFAGNFIETGGGAFRKIYEDSAGNRLLANANNASLQPAFDSKIFDSFLNHRPRNEFKHILFRVSRANEILYDADNQLVYCAYSDGLYAHDSVSDYEIKLDGNHVFVLSFWQDKGLLYCATSFNGLLVIKNKNIIAKYNTQNGLRTNELRNVSLTENELWITHQAGIDVVDLTTNVVRHYSKSDGIFSAEILALFFDENNALVITPSGFLQIPKRQPSVNKTPPKARIKALHIKGQSIDFHQALQLESHQNDLVFKISCSTFRSLADFKYQYRLLGSSDTAWIEGVRSLENIRFPNLSAGNFTFQLAGVNEDGIKGAIDSVSFQIKRPFFATWWFAVAAVLLAMGLVSVVFIIRMRRQKAISDLALRKEKVETLLRESQMTSLKAQMNPHFLFNALNAIQEFILSNDKLSANLYLGKFSDLMRMTLELSQLDKISLARELNALQVYLELGELRFSKEFKFQIIVDDKIDKDHVFLPPMLVQPLIENALNHGLLHKKGSKQLNIGFHLNKENNLLKISVEDNGIGRARSAELMAMRPKLHKSFAVNATTKRLELLNTDKSEILKLVYTDLIHNQQPQGTRVELFIPLPE